MMKINKQIKAFISIIMACFMGVVVLLSIKTDVYAVPFSFVPSWRWQRAVRTMRSCAARCCLCQDL